MQSADNVPADSVRMGIGVWSGRTMSPKFAGTLAKAIEDTGHVDQIVFWDQLNSWWPQALWEPSITPLAKYVDHVDSLADPFVACAFALATCEKIGFTICTDALRRDPPELAQMMLTLALATEGRGTLCLGAGEERHIGPFGRNRKIGLKRLEDAVQILQLLLKEHKPVNFEGKVWNLKDAWLGDGGKERNPEILPMGGGPRLTELAIHHGDGVTAGAPFVFADPEKYGESVRDYRSQLTAIGRNPDRFTFGLHHIAFVCKSKDDFEQFVDNPLVRWYAATGGRLHMGDWAAEGIESVMPLEWRYNFDMRPVELSREYIDDVVSRTTPEMVRKTFFYGTPQDIANEIIPFVKQGSRLNLVADLSPLMVEIDPMENIEQMAEVCRLVKAGV